MTPLVQARALSKEYDGAPPVRALDETSFAIGCGELVGIVGPSGSGKSTLLNLLGMLDRPSGGSLVVMGHDVSRLSGRQLAGLRARTIGFVFQQFHLLPALSAVDNVAVGLFYLGVPAAERRRRAADALARVGLAERAHHRPSRLSGGEQQRVAIARALVAGAPLILADEPTGNLDSASGASVMRLLLDLQGQGHTVVIVTHDRYLAMRLPRTMTVLDGRVAEGGA
ncbi:MAG TPA: ABC transporter ATP-binding protein [Acidimicrobiales bacterium]|nr:ABC transporter ATP-binding protein [Acidimicrobiales bacterium]